MPSFILRVMSVSSKGLTVLKVSKILSNRNYCRNYSVICILHITLLPNKKGNESIMKSLWGSQTFFNYVCVSQIWQEIYQNVH